MSQSPPRLIRSTVDRVTAHPTGAHVVRLAELSANSWSGAGRHTLRLLDLPLLMRSGSLRARVEGHGLRLVRFDELADLQVGAAAHVADSPESLESLEATVRECARQQRRLQVQVHARKQIIGMVEQPQGSVDLTDPPLASLPNVATLTAVADARHNVIDHLEAHLIEDMAALRTAERALALAKKRTDNARSGGHVQALRGVELEVEASQDAGEGRLVLDYFVDGVRWAPSYVLELTGDTALLSLHAQVAQATGELWRDTQLSVSTADVRRTTALPKQQAWRIGRSQPDVATGWRPLPSDLPMLFAAVDKAGRPPRPGKPPGARRSRELHQTVQATSKQGERRIDELGLGAPAPMRMGAAMEYEPEAAGMMPPAAKAPVPRPVRMPSPPIVPASTPMAGSVPMGAGAPPPQSARGGAPPQPKRHASPRRAKPRKPAPPRASPPPRAPPPPRSPDPAALLDYGWLRLPHWREARRRGGLRPVTLDSALRAFVEERQLGAGAVRSVAQALQNLRNRQAALTRAALPAGCIDSARASFQHHTPPGPRVTLPSDSRFRGVQVVSGRASVRRVYRVVPRQDAVVQAMIELDNPTGGPLAAGPLRVVEGGGMRARARVDGTARDGRLRVSLGPEDRVRVARNARVREESRGMLSGERALIHEIEVTIANRLPQTVAIEVFEALPDDSEDGAVEVHFDSSEPRAGVGTDPSGRTNERALAWRVEVPAGGQRTLTWGYTITLSSRAELVGGNRREP